MDESPALIPPEDYDKPSSSPRELLALAIEVAKATEENGALQVIANLRKRFGTDLVPPDADPKQPVIPRDAIPFALSFAEESADAGKPLPSMEVDPTDDIIIENFGAMRQWGQTWLANAARCAPMILDDYDRLGDDCQAHMLDLSRVRDPRQAVVCGSGASLDEMTSLLPAFPGIVVCGASNASACVAAGANPHAILAIDSGLGTVIHLMGVPFDCLGSSLISATTINPQVAEMFPTNRKWFTSIVQMHRGAQHPFNVFCHMLFPFIKSFMFQAGCTVNAELLFLNMLVEMQRTTFDAVYLLGVDFSYEQDRSRCSAFAMHDDGSFEKRDAGLSSTIPHVRSDFYRSFNGKLTDETMLSYKRSLLTVWVLTQLPLYDCSSGIITEVPRADFAALAKGGFRRRPEAYDEKLILDSYNEYLTRVGYKPGESSGIEGEKVQGELWQRS